MADLIELDSQHLIHVTCESAPAVWGSTIWTFLGRESRSFQIYLQIILCRVDTVLGDKLKITQVSGRIQSGNKKQTRCPSSHETAMAKTWVTNNVWEDMSAA